MLKWIRRQCSDLTNRIENGKLEFGQLKFTVTAEGKVVDPALFSSCGYAEIDERVKQVVTELPGKWTPASTIGGNTISQDFFLFFGKMGC